MEQAGTDRDRVGAGASRRRWPWLLIAVVLVVGALTSAVVISGTWELGPGESREEVPPPMRPDRLPEQLHSMSIDFETVIDPDADWSAIDAQLDEAGVNAVELNAGRIEFTAFDWEAHPEAAAEAGSDHLTRAARALNETADGSLRPVGLIVDTYVPAWLADHPRAAGISADGRSSTYHASASELTHGEVGRRLVDYVAALCERYDPWQISITELFLSDYTFGSDDRRLFRRMTGEVDWPRTADGAIDEDDPRILAWRAEVIAGLLDRMRAAMDRTRDGAGQEVDLAMEVRIDWKDPARGALESGHDYDVLLGSADRLVLWAYLYDTRRPEQIREITSDLQRAGVDMSRLTVSIGLWRTGPRIDPAEAVSTHTLLAALEAAQTHGITSVNVTPWSLMSQVAWDTLASVWNPGGT